MPVDKTVRFDEDRPRSSRRSRDSALGSSTEQAHVGGRSDRRFTAQDREDQSLNVHALQEALTTANQHLREQKKKNLELEQQLSACRKELRETNASLREKHDESTTLRADNSALRTQAQVDQDTMYTLRQTIAYYQESESEYLMSGGSGESSNGGKTSKHKSHSKHDGEDMKEKLKDRINRNNNEAEASTKHSHRASQVSQKKPTRARSSSRSTRTREPYIEDPSMDRTRPPSTMATRGFDHYTTSPMTPALTSRIDQPMMSPVPRTHQPGVSYTVGGYPSSGNYVVTPLPPKESDRGRRR
ncbi:uncharacterized protein JN550_006957 [Neoarthrinium moseri]|uniref:uncharacterized protein n=1 Tax=Neoarthrinium moseri TaxID=1658444 RepID=UPI001FDE05F7|nr:uncharacterized protein JN550_006957 [Neoarthrinium moseri]KAI1867816.1 hypothetical protein JN550_006957 [Neoarthrinium moseri]